VIKREFRYVALILLFIILFNLLPALYFGFNYNAVLLQTWYDHVIRARDFHEFHTGMNHSLKGVLQRYLSRIPYNDRLQDRDYQNINFAVVSPAALEVIWIVVTGLVAMTIGFVSLRSRHDSREDRILMYGLIACSIVAFAPWTGYNYLTILILPSAAISAYLMRHWHEPGTRLILVLAGFAILFSFGPPLMPGRNVQRAIQVYSPYFFSTLALFLSFVVALSTKTRS
jgi:hypothetical protein